MSYSAGLVFKNGDIGVSLNDVMQALGVGIPDVGTLCTHNNIKMWAKYRPVEYKQNNNLYKEELTNQQRSSVNYGISDIPIWTRGNNKTLGHVINHWVDGSVAATNLPDGYSAPPQGGWWQMKLPTSFYRLTDFNGYYNRAKPPIGGLTSCGIDNGGNITFEYDLSKEGVSAGLTVTYSDLSTLNNVSFSTMYFGVVIVCGSTYYLATQPHTVGNINDDQSLWKTNGAVHLKINSTSGALYTAAINNTAIKVFPVITDITGKDYTNTIITPTAGTTKGTFIAIQPYEETFIGVTFTQPIISNANAWKNTRLSTRLIYYSFNISCVDISDIHYMSTTLQLLNASGSSENMNSVLLSTTINAGSVVTVTGSIDAGQTYSGAAQLMINSEPSSVDTSVFKMPAPTIIIPIDASPRDPDDPTPFD